MAQRSGSNTPAAPPPRVLRVLGPRDLPDAFLVSGPGEAARLSLSVRESFEPGERVELEVSFGAMSDEVLLECVVAQQAEDERADGATRHVQLAIPEREEVRVSYVRHVLAGRREASARSHRRVYVDMEVRWQWANNRFASRTGDLSRGGAFIVSRNLPEVGAKVLIELCPEHAHGSSSRLELDATVTWVKRVDPQQAAAGTPSGFGVHFRLENRESAAALNDVVRKLEHSGAASGSR